MPGDALRPTRATIVFSHANGFPAGCYRLLFEAWRAAGHPVMAVDRYGHDPAYPVTANWARLPEQLLDFVLRHGPGEPVHFVGHSLGGYLSLLAACRRPALARSVVLIDSPLVGGWRAHGVHLMKASGLIRRMAPGSISARRRWQWPSAAAALQHFASKATFARWAPEVLRDYMASGLEADPQGADPDAVRLAFSREVETRIYNALPHHLPAVLRRHPPRCPVSFLAGTESRELRLAGLAATRALVHERFEWLPGTHLFPMERPAQTAAAVLRWLA